jgi:gamma-glutamyltranspeptidase|tara:strand:+ start:2758 stop:2958 length:201 start_codon:yes stop_codon:yes gene_type:complete
MKKFLEVWEDAANSVGGGGVSMPSDAVHDKKKKKVPTYDGRTKAGRRFVERMLAKKAKREAKKQAE